MSKLFSPQIIQQVKTELEQLDLNLVEVDGVRLKPSQCYHFGVSPAHVLFNTNCPDTLKEQVQAILSKYTGDHADSTPQ